MLLYKIFTKKLSHVFTYPGLDNKILGSVVYPSTKSIMVFLILTGYGFVFLFELGLNFGLRILHICLL